MTFVEAALSRFLEAQETAYPMALEELRRGRKASHWIWYVFPQLKGLGHSLTSQKYGLLGLAEARSFWAHPVLGARLRECIVALLSHRNLSAQVALGELDAAKFRSCLTLFILAEPSEPVFQAALKQFFAGAMDLTTVESLRGSQEVPVNGLS